MAGAPAPLLDPAAHRALAVTRRADGDELAAMAHLIAAQSIEAHAADPQPAALSDLLTVATGYFMKGDHEAAMRWYAVLLALDPDIAAAHQNIAAMHADAGRLDEADASRRRAYAISRVFVESPATPSRRLLILCAGRTSGNIPFDTLLSAGASCRVKYVIDFASEDEDARLPAFDGVFNAIGEPDVAAPLMSRIERLRQACGRPWLNAPLAVGRTQRHRLPGLLAGLPDVVTAPCVRHEAPPTSRHRLLQWLADGHIDLPALVRPTETHGGLGLMRCDSLDVLEAQLRQIDGPHYLTQFVDTADAQGHYRKFRVVFVDRRPYAYHLAVSPHWMVHYFSADMLAHGWKLDEERRFIDDPLAALGERAMAAIEAIGQRIDLDYAGIDFTLLPDGRLFVFEANATMLVHRERVGGPLAHKNAQVQRIAEAFERMLAMHLATA